MLHRSLLLVGVFVPFSLATGAALADEPSAKAAAEIASLKVLVRECDMRLERLARDAARIREDIADAERGMRFSSAAAFRASLRECERQMDNWRALRSKSLRRIAELGGS